MTFFEVNIKENFDKLSEQFDDREIDEDPIHLDESSILEFNELPHESLSTKYLDVNSDPVPTGDYNPYARIEAVEFQHESSNFTDTSTPKNKKISKERKATKDLKHLKGKRRRKGERNKLQQAVDGYWTKNLLPFAKKHHFDHIEKYKGGNFLKLYPELQAIKNKHGITMEDYELLYNIQELEEVWKVFFSSKYLYRELMMSRTEDRYKVIYVGFLNKFEDAFRKRKFEGISRIIFENQETPSKHF